MLAILDPLDHLLRPRYCTPSLKTTTTPASPQAWNNVYHLFVLQSTTFTSFGTSCTGCHLLPCKSHRYRLGTAENITACLYFSCFRNTRTSLSKDAIRTVVSVLLQNCLTTYPTQINNDYVVLDRLLHPSPQNVDLSDTSKMLSLLLHFFTQDPSFALFGTHWILC